MSQQSVVQLKETYDRVVQNTLQRVEREGLLASCPPDALQQLRQNWQQALEDAFAELPLYRGSAAAALLKYKPPAPSQAVNAQTLSHARHGDNRSGRQFRPLVGVRVARPSGFAGLPAGEQPAIRYMTDGFKTSHVEGPGAALSGSRAAPPASALTRLPVLKKVRVEEPEHKIEDQFEAMQSGALPVCDEDASAEAKVEKPDDHSKNEQEAVQMIKIADEDNEEYEGCFEDAEIIVAAGGLPKPPIASEANRQKPGTSCAGEESSGEDAGESEDGQFEEIASRKRKESTEEDSESDLGPDEEDAEFEMQVAAHCVTGKLERLRREDRRWFAWLGPGIAQVKGNEVAFAKGEVEMLLPLPL
mmetsp:Transcript_15979/g.36568  ORF Transcript_15979/g.36568 Transcript_15979/m.36568 type:complete len:360 (-) Transcript_15979:43-1122(-)